MHLADGILPASQALAWSGVAIASLAPALARIRALASSEDLEARALFRLSGAILFSVTLFPVPVPLAGACAHMCAAPVMALLVGLAPTAVATVAVLFIQALFFAHGGLGSLGANVLTLGFVGPVVALTIERALALAGAGRYWRTLFACTVADWATYAATAAVLALALAGDHGFLHWFGLALAGFAPVQLPLGLLEGWLSASFVAALERRRPGLFEPAAAAAKGMALVLTLALAGSAHANTYEGTDELVVGRYAREAGRTPRPALKLPGEIEESLRSLFFFTAGVVASRAFQQVTRRRDAR